MKLNEKHKYTAVIAVLALFLAGLGTLTFFKFQERVDKLEKLDDYIKQERIATEKIQRIPALRESRDRLAATVDDYAAILPQDSHVEQDAFVDTIDGYRRDTDIVIRRAEYLSAPPPAPAGETAPAKPSTFVRHRYKFELTGTVPHLISFLNKIENHTRFLKIDALNVRPAGAPVGAGSFDTANPELELEQADQALKDVDLTISTYTYLKGA